jgi:hypothetical protein
MIHREEINLKGGNPKVMNVSDINGEALSLKPLEASRRSGHIDRQQSKFLDQQQSKFQQCRTGDLPMAAFSSTGSRSHHQGGPRKLITLSLGGRPFRSWTSGSIAVKRTRPSGWPRRQHMRRPHCVV